MGASFGSYGNYWYVNYLIGAAVKITFLQDVYYWGAVSTTAALIVVSIVTGNYRISAIAFILAGIAIYDFQQHQKIGYTKTRKKIKVWRECITTIICSIVPICIVYFSHLLPPIWLSVLVTNLVLPFVLSKTQSFVKALMLTIIWILSTAIGVVCVLYFGN